MESNGSVVPARDEDLRDIMDMINELAKFEGMQNSITIDLQQLVTDFKTNKFNCIVGKEAGEIVGFALYVFTFDIASGKNVYLEDFFIKEKYRNKGFGTKIWNSLIDICMETECLYLEFSVLNWNMNAIQFYLKRGAMNCTETESRQLYRLTV